MKRSVQGKAAGFFNVGFSETIGPLFPLKLFPNTKGQFGGYFRLVSDEVEFDLIRRWMSDNSDVVFIRSLFTTALAACEHYEEGQRSKVGGLEHRAKWEGDEQARKSLAQVLVEIFKRLHTTSRIDAIVSVPPSNPNQQSLPNLLAELISCELDLPNLTAALRWAGQKPSIKSLEVNDRWKALSDVGLVVDGELAGKDLLLIDDMYQSGTTAHFVGSRLREAGADDVHMLAVSKGQRDTDNT